MFAVIVSTFAKAPNLKPSLRSGISPGPGLQRRHFGPSLSLYEIDALSFPNNTHAFIRTPRLFVAHLISARRDVRAGQKPVFIQIHLYMEAVRFGGAISHTWFVTFSVSPSLSCTASLALFCWP